MMLFVQSLQFIACWPWVGGHTGRHDTEQRWILVSSSDCTLLYSGQDIILRTIMTCTVHKYIFCHAKLLSFMKFIGSSFNINPEIRYVFWKYFKLTLWKYQQANQAYAYPYCTINIKTQPTTHFVELKHHAVEWRAIFHQSPGV